MTTETFFEKFEQFAEAPNSVQALRDIAIQLAIQGKLTDQMQCDGDVEQLLALGTQLTQVIVAELTATQ